MSKKIDRALLHRQWVHSQEEDTANEMVFRPAGTPLPPARGRTGFELKPDLTAAHLGIGQTDTTEETAGSWELEEGDPPRLRIRLATGETQLLPIVSVEKDRLVVKKGDD